MIIVDCKDVESILHELAIYVSDQVAAVPAMKFHQFVLAPIMDDEPVEACSLTNGLASIGEDCDDTDATINPLAPEVCDEIDNNCNDIINERFSPSFVDFYTYVGERSAISVDSAGQVHVTYRDETEQQLVYRQMSLLV